MKKLWMIVPAMFLVASCGSAEPTTTTTGTSTPTTTTPTTPVGPVVADVTISVTVSGIDTYEGGHQFIWINSDALGSATEWGAAKLTQDTTNQNKWSIVIEDFELEQAITYNLYYGTETAPDWTNGKNVIEGDSQTIVTEEGTTSYDVAATFHVPTVTGQVNVRYYVNPKIITTSGGSETDISDGNYVWAYNNLDADNVKLEKQLDGTWLFARDNVDLLDGVATVQLTCVLGSNFGPDWDYQQGAWESGTWQKWDNGVSFEFTADTAEHTDNVYFNGEPAVVTGTVLTIHYFESNDCTIWPTSRWLNYSYTDSTLGSSTKAWAANPEWDDDLGGYSVQYQFNEDLVYLEMGVYINSHDAFVGSSTTVRLAVTFTAGTASFDLTATFTADATGYAGVVTNAVGCTVA